MCCILCEEPVRSLTIGLAAVGLVTIVRTVQKSLKSARAGSNARKPMSALPSLRVRVTHAASWHGIRR